jgi:hypothetical protein
MSRPGAEMAAARRTDHRRAPAPLAALWLADGNSAGWPWRPISVSATNALRTTAREAPGPEIGEKEVTQRCPRSIASFDGYVEDEAGNFDWAAPDARCVDECHLFLGPIVVGGGKHALPDGLRAQLELLGERRFRNGVVHLRYRVSVRPTRPHAREQTPALASPEDALIGGYRPVLVCVKTITGITRSVCFAYSANCGARSACVR